MSISNLERKIRFSDCTVEEYRILESNYRQKMLPILLENTDFISILETKGDGSQYIKPKAEIEREATAFANSSDHYLATFGKAILKFLAEGAKDITDVLIAIDGIIVVGGATLSTAITLMIAIILYAFTVMPFMLFREALWKQEDRIWRYLQSTDKNINKYEFTVANLRCCDTDSNGNSEPGVPKIKDIHKFANMIPVSESMVEFIGLSNQGVLEHQANINPELKAYCSILESIYNRLGNRDEISDYSIMEAKLSMLGELSPEDYTYQS